RLIEKIGEGGMGVVWRAEDTRLEREIALKLLPDSFTADPRRRARFEREAK
ncbi:MAG: serine/threonine protein kinase, partial [Acidobacteria bacterium]|nr:serine/threonine protein kinase [Acidobacteriota bacterium]NIQ84309.1 serine/threonine protein kinase [Acidobacteriota bacterium]